MCDSSSALHSKRQTLNVMAPEEVSILLELFRSHNSVLLTTSSCKLLVVSWVGLMWRGWRAYWLRGLVYCFGGVLCVSPLCAAKGCSVSEVSAVNGGRGTPSVAGRGRPPLRALRQNAMDSTKHGG